MARSPNAPAPISDTRYREMVAAGLDHIDQGVTIFDQDLRLVTCNRSFLTLLDFPESLGAPGTPFEAFIRHNAERGEYGEGDVETQVAERVAAAQRFTSHDTRRQRPDGTLLKIQGFPLPHQGFIALYSDITKAERQREQIDRHQAELESRIRERTVALTDANAELKAAIEANRQITAALQHSEAKLRLITDTIPAHVAYFDASWTYRYANKRYAEWFGWTSQSMVDRPIPEVIGDTLFHQVEPHVRRALDGHEVTYEYAITSATGARIFARSTLLPDITPEGEVIGCFVHAVDMTDQRRTQNALAQAQKMEAIGQLTGGLAHDFNNMLTVMMGNLVGLREALGDAPEVAEFVAPCMAAAEGGAGLIQRLLAFSRQQPMEARPVEVNELVLGMARLVRRSLPGSIALSTASREAELVTLVDPGQLESALLNLALNARDAMPHGGELRIESALETLDEAAAADLEVPPGEYVQISIADNGTGMDGTVLARVFEPFFTTKKFGMGSGLGMAMVYGFVKQSGGAIRIRSRQAVGTQVALLLPRAPAGSRPAAPGSAGEADIDLRGRVVLLVEDDPEVRKVVRAQLASLECTVLEAENGQEAADLVENVPAIAMVLSDVVMPGGMDGWALARFVRRFRPEIPMVLMSGYADVGQRHQDDDGLPLLEKPFSREKLAAALNR
ncbi:PAS-domain containing protein [Denitromonas iodatirespirans]|uniref:histidine kinase n=1 Tax=Denitromonas iodatirespirans TaxID=2795389 RepID=A0A944D949_DENI1|nr:PAS-domain containing protein [Denitromonas iodatirespirans]MBT0960651.1 PAS-domain containing protein [Denitromonas iodatirespirans]